MLVRPGKDNTCGKRFQWKLGGLPCGYDHKFTYSHIGYNLKLTDMQAAVGVAQLKKLPRFIDARRRNFALLHEGFADLEEFFILPRGHAEFRPELVRIPGGRPPGRPLYPRVAHQDTSTRTRSARGCCSEAT